MTSISDFFGDCWGWFSHAHRPPRKISPGLPFRTETPGLRGPRVDGPLFLDLGGKRIHIIRTLPLTQEEQNLEDENEENEEIVDEEEYWFARSQPRPRLQKGLQLPNDARKDDDQLVVETNPAPPPQESPEQEVSNTPDIIDGLKVEDGVTNPAFAPETAIENEKSPLLFFIHGIGGSGDDWTLQTRFFAKKGFESVTFDFVGHGMSEAPAEKKMYTFESLVSDTLAVFDHFIDGNRQAIVIAHGYGGSVGSVISRVRSSSIVLFVSIAGGGPTPLVPGGSSGFLGMFNRRYSGGRFIDGEGILPPNIQDALVAGQDWGDGDAAFHRRIGVPTLLVYGLRDKVVHLVEECEMERTIPRAFLELLPSAGHRPMHEAPNQLNNMILKFIQSWL